MVACSQSVLGCFEDIHKIDDILILSYFYLYLVFICFANFLPGRAPSAVVKNAVLHTHRLPTLSHL